jgi:hypothetical protein
VNGKHTIIDTNTSTSEQLIITNDGTGPALVVNQTGNQPIVDIQDEGVSVLSIADGGNVGIGTTNPRAKLHVNDTGAIIMPSGTTAQQPSAPVVGMVRFNADLNRLQFYNTFGWSSIGYMDGYSAQTAATSALYLKNTLGYTTSGIYWIKHGTLPIQMYCDMTTNGGGWMCLAIEYSYSTTSLNNGGSKIDQYGFNFQTPPLFQGSGTNYYWAVPKLSSPLVLTEMYASKLTTPILNDIATSVAIAVSITGQWPPNASYNATNTYANAWCTAHYFGNITNRFEWWNNAMQTCGVNTALDTGYAPRRIVKNGTDITWNGVVNGTGTANNFGFIMGR